MSMNCERAEGAGLTIRPLADTIAATAAWLAGRDNTGAWKTGTLTCIAIEGSTILFL